AQVFAMVAGKGIEQAEEAGGGIRMRFERTVPVDLQRQLRERVAAAQVAVEQFVFQRAAVAIAGLEARRKLHEQVGCAGGFGLLLRFDEG
ncbi:hypothetical protein DD881_13865, partial [Staphylococcus pseudintermedius]